MSDLCVILYYMKKNSQLTLISFDSTWQLDRKTIQVGKAGLAKARAALAEKNRASHNIDSIAA